jgi:hypothetical protein
MVDGKVRFDFRTKSDTSVGRVVCIKVESMSKMGRGK